MEISTSSAAMCVLEKVVGKLGGTELACWFIGTDYRKLHEMQRVQIRFSSPTVSSFYHFWLSQRNLSSPHLCLTKIQDATHSTMSPSSHTHKILQIIKYPTEHANIIMKTTITYCVEKRVILNYTLRSIYSWWFFFSSTAFTPLSFSVSNRTPNTPLSNVSVVSSVLKWR